MNNSMKKPKSILAFMIVIVLTVTMLIPLQSFAAAALTDISGFWAENEVKAWVDQGLINGYPDGTFKPNNTITRAEFVALVNRVLKFTDTAPVTFPDATEKKWFYSDIAKAEKAGYLSELKDGSFKFEENIVRQEVAAIIFKLKSLTASEADADTFKDAADITARFKGFVGAVSKEGFMKGYPDGKFLPVNKLTRAEAVVALNNLFKIAIESIKDQKGYVNTLLKVQVKTTPADAAITAASSDESIVKPAVNGSNIELKGIKAGTVTITVTARKAGLPDGMAAFKFTVQNYSTGGGGGGGGGGGSTNNAPAINVIEPDGVNDGIITLVQGSAFVAPAVTASDKEDGDITGRIVKTGEDKVDTSRIGEYILTYNVKDSKNKAAAEAKVTVRVIAAANRAPVITVAGVADNTITIIQGGTFTAPVVTASDPEDGDITGSIIKTGEDLVDTSKIGEYILTYNVTDSKGLAAAEVRVTVDVVEAIEKANITVDVTNIPSFVYITVNSSTVGSRFKAEGTNSEDFGKAVEVYVPAGGTIVVSILDAAGRVIGKIPVDVTEDSTKDYTFRKIEVTGATANITVDVTNIPSFVYITVNSSTVGSRFKVEGTNPEDFGKAVEVYVSSGDTKVVSILDDDGNVIGSIPVDVKADSTNDYAFTPIELTDASANVTVDVTNIPSFVYITVNSSTVGSRFKVEGTNPEDFGKAVEVYVSSGDTKVVSILDDDGSVIGSITVNVKTDSTMDYTFQVAGSVNCKPVITLTEPDGVADGIITVVQGQEFTEPTVTASDPEDGDITGSIIIAGTVDTSAAGEYTVTYNVTDSKGLAADERSVLVRVVPPSERKANITVNVIESLPVFVYITVNSTTTEGTQFRVQNSSKVVPIGQTIKTMIASGDNLTVTILDAGGNEVGTITVGKQIDSVQDYLLD